MKKKGPKVLQREGKEEADTSPRDVMKEERGRKK